MSRNCRLKAKPALAALAALLIFAISSCDDPVDFDLQGTSLGDPNRLRKADTFSIRMQTQRLPALPGENFDRNLIGTIHEPVYGKSTAIVYSEVRLGGTKPNFGSSTTPDSVILRLSYAINAVDIVLGDPSDVQRWVVYELEDDLGLSSTYRSDTSFRVKATPIGTYNGSFNPADTAGLRIVLANDYGQRIMTASENVLSSNSEFIKTFRGIALIPDSANVGSNAGAIIKFNFEDIRSRIRIHYNGNSFYDLELFNTSNTRVNTYRHNYAGTPVMTQLQNPQTFYERVYLQGMSGLRVYVDLPYLRSLIDDSAFVIHQALIRFPSSDPNIAPSEVPLSALLFKRKADGSQEPLEDAASGATIAGGNWLDDRKAYQFTLTLHLDEVLDQMRLNPNYTYPGMYLFIPNQDPVSARHVELATQQATTGPQPVLEFLFTKTPIR